MTYWTKLLVLCFVVPLFGWVADIGENDANAANC